MMDNINKYIKLHKAETNNDFIHWSDGLELLIDDANGLGVKLNTQQVMYIYNEIKKYDTNKGK